MTLIVLLICLALQYYTNTAAVLPRYNWVTPYSQWLNSLLKNMPAGNNIWRFILLLIPPLAVVGIIDLLLHARIYGLLEFLFGLIVLLYCMKAENLHTQLRDYLTALHQQDFTKAKQAAEFYSETKQPLQPAELCRNMTRLIYSKVITQVFSYIFWFALLGAYGVILYYVVSPLRQSAKENKTIGQQAQAILDWIPIRLAGLSYALVGHFGAGFSYWLKNFLTDLSHNDELAWKVGLAAQNKDPNDPRCDVEENETTIRMVNHAVIVWLVAIALVVVGYWFA